MEQTKRTPGLSASYLKIVAMVLMCVDHLALLTLSSLAGIWLAGGLPGEEGWMAAYFAMRGAGRLAFPLFAFFIAEGFRHTRSAGRYAARLAVFALLAEVPFDLAIAGRPFAPEGQNVLFTLLLGLLALVWLKAWGGRPLFGLTGVLLCLGAAQAMHADYGGLGAAFIPLFWMLPNRPGLRFGGGALLFLGLGLQNFVQGGGAAGLAAEPAAALGAVSCLLPLAGLLAFPLIRAYNGERGRRLPRYLFYAFYPAQFLVFWLLSLAIERLGG